MATASALLNNDSHGVFMGGSFTLDIGSILTAANEDETVSVPNVRVGDLVVVNPSAALLDGLIIANPHVSATGTITFTIENNSASTRDQGSATFYFTVIRGSQGIML